MSCRKRKVSPTSVPEPIAPSRPFTRARQREIASQVSTGQENQEPDVAPAAKRRATGSRQRDVLQSTTIHPIDPSLPPAHIPSSSSLSSSSSSSSCSSSSSSSSSSTLPTHQHEVAPVEQASAVSPVAVTSPSLPTTTEGELKDTQPSSAASPATASSTALSASLASLTFEDSETVLREEILANLRRRESKWVTYAQDAAYEKYRRMIIDWMCSVGSHLRIATSTIHMAVKHMDRILQNVEVSRRKFQIIAMCCILVAAKFDEPDYSRPTIEMINSCSETRFTLDAIRQYEVLVLKELHWQLAVTVPAQFLDIYYANGVVFHSDLVDGQPATNRIARNVRKFADFFNELALQEYRFQQYPASLVAASVVVCARRAANLQSVWHAKLAQLTGYTPEEVAPVYTSLYEHYLQNFPEPPGTAVSPNSVAALEATFEESALQDTAVVG